MDFPAPDRLIKPVSPYDIGGYSFRQQIRRRFWLTATHLGEDIAAGGGTAVVAIGAGVVLQAEIRAGSPDHKNWGGLVVVGHRHHQSGHNFYSIYGHLRDLAVLPGDVISESQLLGVVAEALTPENGWWKIPHLHFAIYTGPWRGVVLPGFKRTENIRTKIKWWQAPGRFIDDYNQDRK